MSSDLAISASGITKRFGDTVALDGVDLAVPRGTVCGLLGPNGAGKTTTVNILTTLLAPDEGTAQVLGHDVRTEDDAIRQEIGLAGQAATVDGMLTGRENLELVARLYHLPRAHGRERADELLSAFGLAEAADRVAKGYSGGMRRRLDLAAALVAAPPLLVLDEPTTGLDPRSRGDLWDLLVDLVRDGTTLLLTTQYLEEADRLADRISVVDAGKVIAEGTSSELKARLGGERIVVTAERGEDLPRLAEALAGLSDEEPVVEADVRRVSVGGRGGPGVLAEAATAIERSGVATEDLGLRRPTLDDVFLQLTGHGADALAAPDAAGTTETVEAA